MIGVMVAVHSLFIGSTLGPIHIVVLPSHAPAPCRRNSCILPGAPAAMHACMSAAVQPGGSFSSRAAGLASLGGSAKAIAPATRAIPASDNAVRFQRLMIQPPK